ncbi:MAG: HEAT repeat domain-containing protein [Anaerolineae bacterium]|nr:HEAT repeat domain-containing protein [Anaerolineae bacterium]
MTQHIFVSYKHENHDFATQLIRQLEVAGFKVWIDVEQLRAGENWREAINQAIKDSFALIFIITPNAKKSEFVTYEWAFAQGAGVKVIPIMLQYTAALHPQLEQLQYLDFTDTARPPWDRLIRRLYEIQGESQPNTVMIPRDAPPAVKSAVAALDSHNAEERRSALKSLAQMNHTSAYAALVGAVQHPMRDVRVDAAFLLAKQTGNKEPAAVPGLLDALTDEDTRIRLAACKVLGEIGSPSAVPTLLKLLNKEADGDLRWAATQALSKMGDAAAPGLIAALKDEDWKVRRSAADALWGLREPSAVEALAEAMTDRNDVVRQAATGAMEQMGEGAVTGLINVLKTSSGPVKQVAAQMLQKIGSPAALQALQQATAPLPQKPTRPLDNRR